MFDVYHSTAPSYITQLSKRCREVRLRSTARGDYVVPTTRLRFADKSFALVGPKAWNSLPQSVRNVELKYAFRRYIKTFYFKFLLSV